MYLFHNKKLYIFAKFFIDKSFIGALYVEYYGSIGSYSTRVEKRISLAGFL